MSIREYGHRMRDGDIRAALHARLGAHHSSEPDTQFVDELGLCGTVRVDVAVVNGTFSGYELKSDRDTLRRLPTQVEVYSKVLDRATLVVGERHLAHERTLAMLPSWWGVIVARHSDDCIALEETRPAAWNDNVDPGALSQLLWREEALAELAIRGLNTGVRTKPRRLVAERLADQLPVEELRAVVRHRLKTREGWRQPPPRV
jgi:hypothetical protein